MSVMNMNGLYAMNQFGKTIVMLYGWSSLCGAYRL